MEASGQAWGLAHSLRALGTSPRATIVTEKWGVSFSKQQRGSLHEEAGGRGCAQRPGSPCAPGISRVRPVALRPNRPQGLLQAAFLTQCLSFPLHSGQGPGEARPAPHTLSLCLSVCVSVCLSGGRVPLAQRALTWQRQAGPMVGTSLMDVASPWALLEAAPWREGVPVCWGTEGKARPIPDALSADPRGAPSGERSPFQGAGPDRSGPWRKEELPGGAPGPLSGGPSPPPHCSRRWVSQAPASQAPGGVGEGPGPAPKGPPEAAFQKQMLPSTPPPPGLRRPLVVEAGTCGCRRGGSRGGSRTAGWGRRRGTVLGQEWEVVLGLPLGGASQGAPHLPPSPVPRGRRWRVAAVGRAVLWVGAGLLARLPCGHGHRSALGLPRRLRLRPRVRGSPPAGAFECRVRLSTGQEGAAVWGEVGLRAKDPPAEPAPPPVPRPPIPASGPLPLAPRSCPWPPLSRKA